MNKLQVFHFRSTVHTNTTPTVIIHTRACYKNHRSATIMVVSLNLRMYLEQIGTSVSFSQKKLNAETLKAIVCQTAPLAKLPPGGSYLFMKYDVFRQNAEFFKGIELISFKLAMQKTFALI